MELIIPPPSSKINPPLQTKKEAALAALGNVRKIAASRLHLDSKQQSRDEALHKKFALGRISVSILREIPTEMWCRDSAGSSKGSPKDKFQKDPELSYLPGPSFIPSPQSGPRNKSLLPATCFCGQALLPTAVNPNQIVRVMYEADRRSASFGGLQQCGSPWLCVDCATKLAERKKERLSLALSRHRGSKALITYTIPHKKEEPLSLVLERLVEQRRALRRSHAYRDWKREWGVVHHVTALEVTWSALNGWHPHFHEVCLFAKDHGPSSCGSNLRAIWADLCKKNALAANQHCLDYKQADSQHDYIASYLEKFGCQPCQNAIRKKWTVEKEISGSPAKRDRGGKCPHYNQWQLLDLARQGKVWAKHLWIEFALSFKGKHQLTPSRGFWKDLCPELEEKTDADLVKEDGKNAVCIGEIDAIVWRSIRQAHAQWEILGAARDGDWAAVQLVINRLIADRKQKMMRSWGKKSSWIIGP